MVVCNLLITGAHGDSYWRAAARCVGSHLSRKRTRPSCMSWMRRSCAPSRARLSLRMLSMFALYFSEANWMARMPSERCWNFVFQPSMTSCRSSVVTICGDTLCVEGVELSTFGTPSRNTTSSPSLWPSLSNCESCDSSRSLIFV